VTAYRLTWPACRTCGGDTFRPEAYTPRRPALRCWVCNLVCGRCTCPPVTVEDAMDDSDHLPTDYRPSRGPCQCPACGCDTEVPEGMMCDGCASDTDHLPCDPGCTSTKGPHVGPDGRLVDDHPPRLVDDHPPCDCGQDHDQDDNPEPSDEYPRGLR